MIKTKSVETIEKTISTCEATSAGESHHTAPCEISGSAFCFVRLKTWREYPALSNRTAIGVPIKPSPMKPIFSFIAAFSPLSWSNCMIVKYKEDLNLSFHFDSLILLNCGWTLYYG